MRLNQREYELLSIVSTEVVISPLKRINPLIHYMPIRKI